MHVLATDAHLSLTVGGCTALSATAAHTHAPATQSNATNTDMHATSWQSCYRRTQAWTSMHNRVAYHSWSARWHSRDKQKGKKKKEGCIILAATPAAFWALMCCRAGKPKARVLPDPVAATPTRS